MSKQPVKIIKRNEGESKPPTKKKEKPKKKRSIESTIKDWITERRETTDIGIQTRSSQFNAWNPDSIPAKAA
jgi:hypothetical protein